MNFVGESIITSANSHYATVTTRLRAMARLERFCDSKGIASIHDFTAEHGRLYAEQLCKAGLTPRSVSYQLSQASAMLQLAVDHGILATNPFSAIRVPTALASDGRAEISPATAVEIATVSRTRVPKWCPECAANITDAVKVAAMSGLRIDELCKLKWEDVRNGLISVRNGKAREARTIPIMPALQDVLNARKASSEYVLTLRTHKPFNRRQLSRLLALFLKDADFVDDRGNALTAPDLRRVFLTICRMCGVPNAYALPFLGRASSLHFRIVHTTRGWEWGDFRNVEEGPTEGT